MVIPSFLAIFDAAAPQIAALASPLLAQAEVNE